MYIKLGKTNIEYDEDSNSNFMIFSEIVDSSLSYEKPVLVRSVKELNIWFGKNFTDYDYLVELLKSGITLYLYRPVRSSIDLTGFREDQSVKYNSNTPLVFDTPTIKSLPEIGEFGVIYNTLEGNRLVWVEGDYEEISELGTFTVNKSLSNRDTLFVDHNGIYCTPTYMSTRDFDISNYLYLEKTETGYKWARDLVDVDLETGRGVENPNLKYHFSNRKELEEYTGANIQVGDVCKLDSQDYFLDYNNLGDIENELVTYAFRIDPSNINRSFVVIKDPFSTPTKYYILHNPNQKISDIQKANPNLIELTYLDLEEFKQLLINLGYIVKDNIVYTLTPLKIIYFGNILEPDQDETQRLIWSTIQPTIKFWSKTIGNGGPDGKITIERRSDGVIEVSRFGYTETWDPQSTDERLDYLITRESKLVGCTFLDPNKLPRGKWTMRGSWNETYSETDYTSGFGYIKEAVDFPPDYLLVPKYIDYDYVEFASTLGCQVLIENDEASVEKNQIDPYNRVVYFAGNFTTKDEQKRPGYYVYLKSILEDNYQPKVADLIYNKLDLSEDILEKWKSNYLTFNNLYYFYETYRDGENYEMTGLMRFAISKISREFQKHKDKLVGQKMIEATIRKNITQLLREIEAEFNIIRSISLDDLEVNYQESKVSVIITTTTADLVNNNMTLDLTINYKD